MKNKESITIITDKKIGATLRKMVTLTDENRKIIVSKLNKNRINRE
ncbi:hypothetical protein [Flavobacterium tibetense]|jgi:hypothetical protein|nr:hypothetical protein [Flavobacterium tibetense]